MGLTYDDALDMPFSQLLDLIAVQQIKEEGAEYRLSDREEEADFRRLFGL